MKFENWHGFLILNELDLPAGGGIKVDYYRNGRREPACLFPNLTEETLFEPTNHQEWVWATEYRGLVPDYLIRNNAVYWNYFVNFNGLPPESQQTLHIIRFAVGGRIISEDDYVVTLTDHETIFINNWHEWEGAPVGDYSGMEPNRQRDPADAAPGWTVANCEFGQPRLTIFGHQPVSPLSYCPGVSGRYEVRLCLKEEVLECKLTLPGAPVEWIFINPRTIPFNKFWKEIVIGTYEFTPADRIIIEQAPATIYNPIRRFGDIYYFKLVPATKTNSSQLPGVKLQPDQPLVFYSEPFSVAYFHNLQNEKMAMALVDQYVALGVDQVVCQMGRIGAMMLNHSAVAQPGRSGKQIGDDMQSSNGVQEMRRNIDILAVMAHCCRQRGIRLIANSGINSPGRNSTLETSFAMKHPEYYHHHLLDFTIPEVLDFATQNLYELAQYDVTGLNISHTRYPYYQTRETIVAFQRQLVEKIGAKRRGELELGMSFVTDDPEYYAAIETMLAENLIDVLIPGRLMCIYPEIDLRPYVELAHRYGKRVLGLLDGWGYSYSGINTMVLPRAGELQTLAAHYLAQGADGLYFYQSEQILSNPFLKRLVRSLKL